MPLLTPDQVKELLSYKKDVEQKKIKICVLAKMFGVSEPSIHYRIKGRERRDRERKVRKGKKEGYFSFDDYPEGVI